MKEEKNEKEGHPLMKFVPKIFNSFEEWLARWNGTDYSAEKLGLLHSLASGDCWWSRPELVSFLLSIADGYAEESFDADMGYRFCGRCIGAEARKSIAEKAFSVLCLRFFRDGERERDEEPLWWWMLKHEALFQKVLWFLRPREGGYKRLYNCTRIHDNSSDHQQEIFRNFLRKFSRLGWDFPHPEYCRRWDERTRHSVKQRLVEARPQFIEILRGLGELIWLNRRELELDDQSVEKLTKMALGDSFFLPPEKVSDGYSSLRKPKSLEEAVLGGSVEAQIVLLHQIKNRERRRILALYEESVRQRQSQQIVRELAEIERKRKELDEELDEIADNLTKTQ